jgi:hypothetical protein
LKDHSPLTWTARIISLILHPIWLPLIYIAWKAWDEENLLYILNISSIFLVGLPGIVALLWMWMRTEEDWFVMSRANRAVPLLAGMAGIVLFRTTEDIFLPGHHFPTELAWLLIPLLGIGTAITFFWKISLHMLSWGAVMVLTGVEFLDGGARWPFGLALVLTALVAWARMRVKSHDGLQIFAGWMMGMLISFFALLLHVDPFIGV